MHGQHPRHADRLRLAVVAQHVQPISRQGKAGAARLHRMGQRVVVAQGHAGLGLAVMVVDDRAQRLVEPADHLGVERLAGAADHAQLALDRRGRGVAGGHQHAVGGGRPHQIGHAQLGDGAVAAVHGERAFVEGHRMAERQRPGDAVVQPVGPARVGDVPQHVIRPQVHRVAHVGGDGIERVQRHAQRFGRPGGAGGEHDHARVLAPPRHGIEGLRLAFQRGPEVLAIAAAQGQDRRRGGDLVQLGALLGRAHHQRRAAGRQPVLQRLGAEGGEQRLVHRAGAPGAQHHDQQLQPPRQQPGHHRARPDSACAQQLGELGRPGIELFEGVAPHHALGVDPAQRLALRAQVRADAGLPGVARPGRRHEVERADVFEVIADRAVHAVRHVMRWGLTLARRSRSRRCGAALQGPGGEAWSRASCSERPRRRSTSTTTAPAASQARPPICARRSAL